MSKELVKIVDAYSDLLIKVLEGNLSDQLLIKVLEGIDETHDLIDRGLIS